MLERALLACALALLACRSAAAASFDCTKATSSRDRLICATPDLSASDSEMARIYNADLSKLSNAGKASVAGSQRTWLHQLDTECPPNAVADGPGAISPAQCLARAYGERIQLLKAQVVQFGDIVFFEVDRNLTGLVKGEKLQSTAVYPQRDRPPSASWRAWNGRQVMSPASYSACDDGAGTAVTEVDVTFATSALVSVTRSDSYYCPPSPHGFGAAKQVTTLLSPSPHQLVAADLFVPGSHWEDFLTGKLDAAVSAMTTEDSGRKVANREKATDPGEWVMDRKGLTIAFQPYEFGMGRNFNPEAHVSWADLKPYLRPNLGLPPAQ